MGFLNKLFGGGKGNKAPTTSEAIQSIRDTEEMLIKQQDFLETKIQQENKIARANTTKNKSVALQALTKQKRHENEVQKIDGTRGTIDKQREMIESAIINTKVLQTMNDAAKSLQAAHKHMDVDKVHDMMDDIAEQQELGKEISEAISNPFAFRQDVDESELLAVFEELKQEELDKKLLETGMPSSVSLPEVPAATPARREPAKKQEEDPDMAELAAWAS